MDAATARPTSSPRMLRNVCVCVCLRVCEGMKKGRGREGEGRGRCMCIYACVEGSGNVGRVC